MSIVTCESFSEIYWAHYVSLEKEFSKTLSYVSLSHDNFSTYSEAYVKLMLQIGSEVDIALKNYCKILQDSFSGSRISEYQKLICEKNHDFCRQTVLIRPLNKEIQPWSIWCRSSRNSTSPYWWTVYNKVKHERLDKGTIGPETKEYYKFANLKNTLFALAGLYQILVFTFYNLATNERKKVVTPLPGSRVFQLTGSNWDEVNFFGDFAFYLDDNGYLHVEFSNLSY